MLVLECCGAMSNCFFFFKQKTAYEMRISDWSSDVCSSDLRVDEDVPGSPASEPAQPVEHQCRSVALALLAGGDGEALEVAARPRPAGDGVAHDLFVVVDGHPQSGGRQIGRAHV